nr:unnamed protein product [Digitaria exilis]
MRAPLPSTRRGIAGHLRLCAAMHAATARPHVPGQGSSISAQAVALQAAGGGLLHRCCRSYSCGGVLEEIRMRGFEERREG